MRNGHVKMASIEESEKVMKSLLNQILISVLEIALEQHSQWSLSLRKSE